MGACAAHFKQTKHKESLPSSDPIKYNSRNHSPKIMNTSDVHQIVSDVTQEQFHSIILNNEIENKKQMKSKQYFINERILNWISKIDRDDPISPPKSMLSLHTLLIREQESPLRKTNKQEIIEQKHCNKQNVNVQKTVELIF